MSIGRPLRKHQARSARLRGVGDAYRKRAEARRQRMSGGVATSEEELLPGSSRHRDSPSGSEDVQELADGLSRALDSSGRNDTVALLSASQVGLR